MVQGNWLLASATPRSAVVTSTVTAPFVSIISCHRTWSASSICLIRLSHVVSVDTSRVLLRSLATSVASAIEAAAPASFVSASG